MREIQLYKSENGRSPVEDFLESLPGKLYQKISWTLNVVRELPIVPKEYFKKLSGTNDIWEIRVHLGSDAVRLLAFFDGNEVIILTNGFIKKTDKVPKREIELAEERKKDYLRRKRI
jgi:phage-related protein